MEAENLLRDTCIALTNTGNLWQAALHSANKAFGTLHYLHSVPEGHRQAKLLFPLTKFRSSSQVTIYYHLAEKTLAVFLLLSAFQSPRGIFSGNPIRVCKISSKTYGRKPWYSLTFQWEMFHWCQFASAEKSSKPPEHLSSSVLQSCWLIFIDKMLLISIILSSNSKSLKFCLRFFPFAAFS